MKKRIIVAALCAALLLTGCTAGSATNLMGQITPDPPEHRPLSETATIPVTDFEVRLFQETVKEGKNVLVSPLSVLYALAMTANGAKGETLAEMEETFGMAVPELNQYLYDCMDSFAQSEKCKMNAANSIWFKDSDQLTVETEFLQTNADFYGADVYKAPLTNKTTREMNRWVEENTDSMIDKIIDNIPENAVMYLVNALSFDAEWNEPYPVDHISIDTFHNEDGTESEIEFMGSDEYNYFEDDGAQGFLKYYKDAEYAFAALLPNENVSLDEYVASLTEEKLNQILTQPQSVSLYTKMPMFSTSYSVELSPELKNMGITKALNQGDADLSGIGAAKDGALYINRVQHKAFITVDERGTRAGAASAVGVLCGGAAPQELLLDRPFMYMIVQCDTGLPIFMGIIRNIK